jgi:RNA polymerase sigma-70 factor (ECF subfamily)
MALVGVRAEADELAQESLLTAHASLESWRGEGSVRAWLFGIARKQCARHVEKQRRQTAKLRLVASGESPNAEDLVAFRERADQARAALERVRPSEREAVVLRYVGQLTFAEVAEACGIDEAAARTRVSRAILRLRAELGEAE